MSSAKQLLETEHFRVELPHRYQHREDAWVSPDPPGAFSLLAEEVTNSDELPNLSRMLAGFLTRSGHPVATDELLAVKVTGAKGFTWQYVSDERYHRFWIFGNRSRWLLLTFVCPEQQGSRFQPELKELVSSFVLLGDA